MILVDLHVWLLHMYTDSSINLSFVYNSVISGFSEYVESGAEALYQTLCSEITTEFSECSKQVWILSECFFFFID